MGVRAEPQTRRASSSLALLVAGGGFSLAQRPWNRQRRWLPAWSPGHEAVQAAAGTGGCHSAAARPAAPSSRGLGRQTPALGRGQGTAASPPVCLGVPLPGARGGDGGGSGPVTPEPCRGQCRSRIGVLRVGGGVTPAWWRGAGGCGRAGAGPCPPALRHRCSPNTPDLKRRFLLGAGGRGPRATRGRDSPARPRAGSCTPPPPLTLHPPAPDPMPRGWSPGQQQPPPWDGAGQAPAAAVAAAQQSGLVLAWPPLAGVGRAFLPAAPRSGPPTRPVLTGPSLAPPPPAAPDAHRGHGATSSLGRPSCRGLVPKREQLRRVPGWEPGERRSRKPIGSCWKQPRR